MSLKKTLSLTKTTIRPYTQALTGWEQYQSCSLLNVLMIFTAFSSWNLIILNATLIEIVPAQDNSSKLSLTHIMQENINIHRTEIVYLHQFYILYLWGLLERMELLLNTEHIYRI